MPRRARSNHPWMTERLNEWIAEGHMTRELVFQRLTKILCYSIKCQKELENSFKSLCVSDDTGTEHVTETAFISLLTQTGAIPQSMPETGPVLYRILHYLSGYPLHHYPSPALSLDDWLRAFGWLTPWRDGIWYERGPGAHWRTPADARRTISQSIATGHEGEKLPYSPDEWSRQALRRAFEFPESDSQYRESANPNCDEDGDEMYHDVLDVVFTAQVEVPAWIEGVPRDLFRGLARQLHGHDLHLHQLTVPPDTMRIMAKYLLIQQLGTDLTAKLICDHYLDYVIDCIVRAFMQNSNAGVNWAMFDEASKKTPTLFKPLESLADYVCLGHLPNPLLNQETAVQLPKLGKLIRPHTLLQLNILLQDQDQIWYKDIEHLLYVGFNDYNPQATLLDASAFATALSSNEDSDRVLVLFSGREMKTREQYTLGAFIPCPSKDGKRIQHAEWKGAMGCLLFELSPVHDVYYGTVGSPAWTMEGDDLAFGDPNSGVALLLKNNSRRATFVQKLDGEDEPIYSPTAWRGNRHVELELDGVEIWLEK